MPERALLTAEERALPYSKFYDLPITPIPEESWPCWPPVPSTPPGPEDRGPQRPVPSRQSAL